MQHSYKDVIILLIVNSEVLRGNNEFLFGLLIVTLKFGCKFFLVAFVLVLDLLLLLVVSNLLESEEILTRLLVKFTVNP